MCCGRKIRKMKRNKTINTYPHTHTHIHVWGASGGVMVNKQDKQTYMSEFEFQWVPLSYSLVPHLTKNLSELLPLPLGPSGDVMVSELD